MIETIPDDWKAALEDAIDAPSFHRLAVDLAAERARPDTVIYPPAPLVFNALRLTPLASVQAVILGQDPYHGEGQAHGLAFSVPAGRRKPRSLQNIFKARELDVGLPPPASGSLEPWARNGVLLLNTALTVRCGKANSHRLCWEPFTDAVIKVVGAQAGPVAFLLWGRQAQACLDRVLVPDPDRHVIVTSLHPAARPHASEPRFFDSKPFSRADSGLLNLDQPVIGWSLPGDP